MRPDTFRIWTMKHWIMNKGLKKTLPVLAAVAAGVAALGGAALVVTASMPSASIAADKTVSGRVTFHERVTLPPEANLTVQLTDLSAAAQVVAETHIDSVAGSPTPFAIHFETTEIKPGHHYALQARIAAGDTLWFVNSERYAVDPAHAAAPVDMHLVMVRKGGDETVASGIEGKDWLAEDIQGGGVIDNAHTTLTVASDGAVSGSGGCNRYVSKATLSGQEIAFADIGSTYMQCPTALMNQERKFLDVLGKTRSYKIDMGKLVLLDEEGREIARLAQSL